MATGSGKRLKRIDAKIGCETQTDANGDKTYRYFFVGPNGKETDQVELMFAVYDSTNPAPGLVWMVTNACDHEIEVQVDFPATGGPPPVTPPSVEKAVPAGTLEDLPLKVRPGAWPAMPGSTRSYPYSISARTATGSSPWQKLDPELELERPFGFSAKLTLFVVGIAVGVAAVLTLQALG